MGSIIDPIAKPLGKFLNLIYENVAFGYYGLALIIFTLIVRLALLPLTVKQYRSTARMQEIQPQIQEIQKRYKNDKEKLNQELMKVYQDNKVNPAGGCLPILIQMPIFFSLWQVISKPLTYMLSWDTAKITDLFNKVPLDKRIAGYDQLSVVNFHGSLDMNFLGLNLGLVPKWNPADLFNSANGFQYLGLLILPIIAVTTTFLSSKLSMPRSNQSNEKNSAAAMQNSMMFIGPLMTLFFSFTFPAGMSLYWISGNIVTIFQQLFINKYVLKKKESVVK